MSGTDREHTNIHGRASTGCAGSPLCLRHVLKRRAYGSPPTRKHPYHILCKPGRVQGVPSKPKLIVEVLATRCQHHNKIVTDAKVTIMEQKMSKIQAKAYVLGRLPATGTVCI